MKSSLSIPLKPRPTSMLSCCSFLIGTDIQLNRALSCRTRGHQALLGGSIRRWSRGRKYFLCSCRYNLYSVDNCSHAGIFSSIFDWETDLIGFCLQAQSSPRLSLKAFISNRCWVCSKCLLSELLANLVYALGLSLPNWLDLLCKEHANVEGKANLKACKFTSYSANSPELGERRWI